MNTPLTEAQEAKARYLVESAMGCGLRETALMDCGEAEWDFPMRPNLDALRATAVQIPSLRVHRALRGRKRQQTALCGWRYALAHLALCLCIVAGAWYLVFRVLLPAALKGIGAL